MADTLREMGAGEQPLDRWDALVALLIFGAVLALLLATTDIGFTRDESFYFHAARDYIKWFEHLWDNVWAGQWRESFQKAEIDRYWSYNNEHPVLMKTLFALSEALFHRKLGWMESSTAMRLPTMAFSALLGSGVYLFSRQLFGRMAGLLAVFALMLQPRFFFHAHMACFDAPIGAMWFLTVFAYWKSWKSTRWAWITGVLWGVALATKLNAFFIPIVLVVHWLVATWTQWRFTRDARGRWQLGFPAMPRAFLAMAALGPLIFYAHWPFIWYSTFARVQFYMSFHLKHVHYFVNYFGENLYQPPFPVSFPVVMTLVTVPAMILAAGALGAGAYWGDRGGSARLAAWRDALSLRERPAPPRDPRATGVLLLLNFVVPIAIIAQPSTPIFGGTKHWIPSMPFLAMCAGLGAVTAARRATLWWQEREGRTAAAASWVSGAVPMALVSVALVLPSAMELERNHPQGTAYYNELIGSYQGAADKGMMRQFWGYSSRQELPWINAHALTGARVDPQNTTSWAFDELRREGLVREDLRQGQGAGSDYIMMEQQKAFHYIRHRIWRDYGVRAPSHVLEIDGVPLVSTYERPTARRERLGETDGTAPKQNPSQEPK